MTTILRLCFAEKSHSPNKNEICIKRMTSFLLSFAFLLVLLFEIDDFVIENISVPFATKLRIILNNLQER